MNEKFGFLRAGSFLGWRFFQRWLRLNRDMSGWLRFLGRLGFGRRRDLQLSRRLSLFLGDRL
jgi:hypothetical protein